MLHSEEIFDPTSLRTLPGFIVTLMARTWGPKVGKSPTHSHTAEWKLWADVQIAKQSVTHRATLVSEIGVYSAFGGEAGPPGGSPSLGFSIPSPPCLLRSQLVFLSDPVNLSLQDIILSSFYPALFCQSSVWWPQICWLQISQSCGCLSTAAQALLGRCIGVSLPGLGVSRDPDQLLCQNCISVMDPGIIRLQLFLPTAG